MCIVRSAGAYARHTKTKPSSTNNFLDFLPEMLKIDVWQHAARATVWSGMMFFIFRISAARFLAILISRWASQHRDCGFIFACPDHLHLCMLATLTYGAAAVRLGVLGLRLKLSIVMWTEASRGLINPFPPVPILLS
jgi:hypothetical protein